MSQVIPVLRVFNQEKALEFYVGWLGFKVDWTYAPEHVPFYMQISLDDIVLHLSEHHGDCSPGAKVMVQDFPALKEYHSLLLEKNYKFNRPGLERVEWDLNTLEMTVIDPFSNRIIFNENVGSEGKQ